MAITVNGQRVPEELIREEQQRVASDLRWQSVLESTDREIRMRKAAEQAAVNRMLLEQAAQADPRPVNPAEIQAEAARLMKSAGCRSAYDDTLLRSHVERTIRLSRLVRDFTSRAPSPSAAQVEEFYRVHAAQFQALDRFRASHIVTHVNEHRNAEEAERAIHAALADLEAGEEFAVVADRHSDCKGQGGDLGEFPAGEMVEEFERALGTLRPGQRTGIFTTPFGFHIALLHSREPGGPASFEDVRPDIEKVMTAMAEHAELQKGIEMLRRHARIVCEPQEESREV
jgi:parvulin-like peptidyl-prolyl isomerase